MVNMNDEIKISRVYSWDRKDMEFQQTTERREDLDRAGGKKNKDRF